MLEATIVADSSPLIGLARIGQLPLLPQLSTNILVPPTVWSEITGGSNFPGAEVISQTNWLQIDYPEPQLAASLAILLGRGEAEALALASKFPNSLLLIDDARARRVAERLNLRRIGTLGLLRRAKQAGLIDQLRPLVEALQANGIYLRQALVDAILKDVGE